MLRPAPAIAAVAALAALGACNNSDDTGPSATGQVLEGTVSDEMLPVDTLTSEAPLAEPTEASGKGGKGKPDKRGKAGADSSAADAPADGEASPAPDPTPQGAAPPAAATAD